MLSIRIKISIFLLLLVFMGMSLYPRTSQGQSQYSAGSFPAASLWSLDFAALSATVRKDLVNLGFNLEHQMANENKIHLAAENGGLRLETAGQVFGFMVKKDLRIDNIDHIDIEWGVNHYPPGANWGEGKNNEPLMVILFFGEPQPGKHFYLPEAPFFIGMFLGKYEPLQQPYTSKSYPATGRYVCLGNPEPGATIISRLDIAKAFPLWFSGRNMPPVTGIAIEIDTGQLSEGVTSSAFINSVRLLKAD